jgi:hypothetical protein
MLLIFSRCIRRLVLGEFDGGGRMTGFTFKMGVKGASIWVSRGGLIGDEDAGPYVEWDRAWVGLKGDELRRRAISSSARPRLMRGRSGSDVSSTFFWFGRMTEDSRDEM